MGNDSDLEASGESAEYLISLLQANLHEYVMLNWIKITPGRSAEELCIEAGNLAMLALDRWTRQGCTDDDSQALMIGQSTLTELLRSVQNVTDSTSKLILAAVWIENWINWITFHAMNRDHKALSENCFYVQMRKLGPMDKLESLWPLLELKELPDRTLRSIRRVVELRNRYVHPKSFYCKFGTLGAVRREVEDAAELAIEVIRDLCEYEDVNFHGGRAAELYGLLYFGEL